ncbi:MAG: SDR family oxidoreductase [Acidobacteriota bacterium]
MRVLIAGCGDVGTRLGLLLIERGHQVWGLRRHPDRLPPQLPGIAADLTDSAGLTRLPGDLDWVVTIVAADQSTEAAYRSAYVDGLRNVLAATASHGVVFVSSTSVYGQDDGGWVDEGSVTEPGGFRGRLMLQAEELALTAERRSVVVRFGGIYGPGRTRLIDSVRSGEAVCFDDPKVYTNRIHVDDCAGSLEHILHLPEPRNLYLGVDHEPAADGTVKRWLARQLGVPEPPSAADRPGVRRRAAGNKRCSNQRLAASGYAFRYASFREGYRKLLEADQAAGSR